MKRFTAFMLAVVMTAAMAACGATERTSFATIEAKDCFYDAGFVEFVAGAKESTEYAFLAENSEGVEWWVYVLDESFEEGFRYIKQVAEPVLIGDGMVSVDAGQFVYIYCSANEFTTGVINETAKLHVTIRQIKSISHRSTMGRGKWELEPGTTLRKNVDFCLNA